MHIDAPPGYLVVDGSLYNDHVNTQQLWDGGVISIIMGMYQQWDGNKYILNTNCERILNQICTDGRFILQTYFYYYPETDPISKANWYIDTIAEKKYPVTWAWADCEAYKAVLDPAIRSEQNRRFCVQLKTRFSESGIYTAKWYIDANAPEMNLWLPGYYNWIPHYGRQPKISTEMTWEELKKNWLPNYDIIIAPGQTGNIVGHQFTGDVCKVPAFYDYANRLQACDVSVFTKEFIDSLRVAPVPAPTICPCCGQPIPGIQPAPVPPVIPANIYYVKDNYNLNVHYPHFDSPSIGLLLATTKIVVDDDGVTNRYWAHFVPTNLFHNGGWVYKPDLRR